MWPFSKSQTVDFFESEVLEDRVMLSADGMGVLATSEYIDEPKTLSQGDAIVELVELNESQMLDVQSEPNVEPVDLFAGQKTLVIDSEPAHTEIGSNADVDKTATTVVNESVSAGVLVWDGGGDGTTWSDAANWAGDLVPVDGDKVVIGDLPGDAVIEFDAGTLSLNGIELSDTLRITGDS